MASRQPRRGNVDGFSARADRDVVHVTAVHQSRECRQRAAKAFKQWLGANGWPDEDVFLDVDNIDAGERWKDALKHANLRGEAVILLASPEVLASAERIAGKQAAQTLNLPVAPLCHLPFRGRAPATGSPQPG